MRKGVDMVVSSRVRAGGATVSAAGRSRSSRARRERAARWLTLVYTVALAVTVVTWVIGRRGLDRFLGLVFGILNVPAGSSLVSIVVLAFVAGALVRRKRSALIAVAAFQGAGAVWSVLVLVRVLTSDERMTRLEALGRVSVTELVVLQAAAITVGLVVLGLCWWLLPVFPARLAPGARWRAAVVLVIGASASLFTARALLPSMSPEAEESHAPWHLVLAALRASVGVTLPGDARELRLVSEPVELLLEVMLALTVIVAVATFLRSRRPDDGWDGNSEVRLRSLLAVYGGADSLGYFATRRDRSYAFSGDNRAVVAYRVVGAVCLASGDPIGARESWPDAVRVWRETARRYGWIPVATSLGEDGARLLAASGFGVISLGDEAILDTERFRLDSTSMTSVRHAVGRARRGGLTVRLRRLSNLSAVELTEVVRRADEWRAGDVERGFSMALDRVGDPADGQCVLVSAHDAAGEMVGLLTLVPWGTTGLSLDLMRRSPSAPSGVTELMVAELMAQGQVWGLRRVSLNFAVARAVFAESDRLGAGPFVKASSGLFGLLGRYTQIESLYRNNERYRPRWSPRYVCIESAVALPAAAFAIARAEGFVPGLPLLPPRESATLTGGQLAEVAEAERAARTPAPEATRRSDQTRVRLRHLDELRAAGRDPYVVGHRDVTRLSEAGLDGLDAEGLSRPDGGLLVLSGRVRRMRRHGGVVFVDLVDVHSRLQVVAEASVLGRFDLALFGRCVDGGDLLVVRGTLGVTRTGTPALQLLSWDVAAKCLQPVPFTGFSDPGLRARRRSTDLIVRPAALDLLRARSAALRAVRDVMLADGYAEVETPILGSVHGGASARPFRTHANAYGVDLVLRIAPEIALKRLLVGGTGPIFEMGRNFRNEGADASHNPEFTVLEAYRPFADYTDMRVLTERLVRAAARAVHGREALSLPGADGTQQLVDVSASWPVVGVCEAVSAAVGQPVDEHTDLETLLRLARAHEVAVRDDMGPGALLEELYGELVEPATVFPTFYVDFPVETSPLTGPHRYRPGLVERWDLVVGGHELGTAYSELTDPLEQRRRLTEQSWKAAAGDPEAMEVDEDFLHSLELGMPPAGGLGIGLDRLVMSIVGTGIRDVLAFPFVRPEPRPSTTPLARREA